MIVGAHSIIYSTDRRENSDGNGEEESRPTLTEFPEPATPARPEK